MGQSIIAFVVGLIFAVGLGLGGMLDPNKVLGFLNVTHGWDPSLAFVMGGAILVYAPVFRWATRHGEPWTAPTFHLPTRRDIDVKLLAGSALFGFGWGLGGYCPGPGLVSTASFFPSSLIFTAAMFGGMGLHAAWVRLQAANKH